MQSSGDPRSNEHSIEGESRPDGTAGETVEEEEEEEEEEDETEPERDRPSELENQRLRFGLLDCDETPAFVERLVSSPLEEEEEEDIEGGLHTVHHRTPAEYWPSEKVQRFFFEEDAEEIDPEEEYGPLEGEVAQVHLRGG